MRSFGKLLQVAGLVILPFAMFMQMTGSIRAPTGGFTVSAMLLLMPLASRCLAWEELLKVMRGRVAIWKRRAEHCLDNDLQVATGFGEQCVLGTLY